MDLVEIDEAVLRERMTDYFDTKVRNEELSRRTQSLMKTTKQFDAEQTRLELQRLGIASGHFTRYCYQPFDDRWVYWHEQTKLLDRNRVELFEMVRAGNLFFTSRQKAERDQEGSPFFVTKHLADWHLTRPGSMCFPLTRKGLRASSSLFGNPDGATEHLPNLTDQAREYLRQHGIVDFDTDETRAGILWMHTLAIGHSGDYLRENEDGLRQDWPRVPLPASRADLRASAELGRRVAALLDPETPVDGVTAGKVRPELKTVGVVTKLDGGQLDGADFAVTARWGITGKGGVTMPGPGRHPERSFTPEEATALGESGVRLLGPDTVDVFLNDTACWRNVPRRVWDYTLGGYQVLKKWLSYREQAVLGRPLTVDEVGYVTQVVRRIAALLLLGPELDANYQRTKADPYPWPR